MDTVGDLIKRTKKVGDCQLWEGFVAQGRYAQIRYQGKLRLVHHVAYELANGPTPHGSRVIRICPHWTCCNPNHLVLDTIPMHALFRKPNISTATWSKRRRKAFKNYRHQSMERLKDLFQSLSPVDENP